MERRKFLIGLGALSAGGAAAVGTGAFDSVDADRTAEVNVAGDDSAYLALTGDDDFVDDDSEESELTIDLGGARTEYGGEGFNDDAVTEVSGVFTIENQGTQDVEVGFVDVDDPKDSTNFEISDGDDAAGDTLEIEGDQSLTPGGEPVDVKVTVDTTIDEDGQDQEVNIDIVANENP